jgi:hypothetical protein
MLLGYTILRPILQNMLGDNLLGYFRGDSLVENIGLPLGLDFNERPLAARPHTAGWNYLDFFDQLIIFNRLLKNLLD